MRKLIVFLLCLTACGSDTSVEVSQDQNSSQHVGDNTDISSGGGGSDFPTCVDSEECEGYGCITTLNSGLRVCTLTNDCKELGCIDTEGGGVDEVGETDDGAL